jgi:transcriptional regulator with XRE-family HTH domain
MTFKETRLRRGLSQAQIATVLKVTVETVSNWECGRSTPTITLWQKLADLLQISLDDLYEMFRPAETTVSIV